MGLNNSRNTDASFISIFWLLMVGIVLPNALFYFLLFFGQTVPPRILPITLYALVVIALRKQSVIFFSAAYVIIWLLDVWLFVAGFFSLNSLDFFRLLRTAYEVRVGFWQNIEYVMLALIFFISATSAIYVFRLKRSQIATANITLMLPVVVALLAVEYRIVLLPYVEFKQGADVQTKLMAATEASGFSKNVVENPTGHHVLVIVEGLGLLANPVHHELVAGSIRAPTGNWTITSGSVMQNGSTTQAELRELCHTQLPYRDFFEPSPAAQNCLPNRAHENGLRTEAYHGYMSGFFSRARWWPAVGLRDIHFAERLERLPTCGTVWEGVCDRALVALLRTQLATQQQPTLFYLLTLNTHVPVSRLEHSSPFPCDGGGLFQSEDICHMAAMWADLFKDISDLTTLESGAPLNILIVGDHPPPLWSRKDRALFVQGEVPWFRLQKVVQ